MNKNKWCNDREYMSYVGELLERPEVLALDNFTQHHFSTRLEHSIAVSYESYKIAKKLHLNAERLLVPVCCTISFTMIGALRSLTAERMHGCILGLR